MKIAVLCLLFLMPLSALAATMHQVNSGASKDINEHGVCQRITNNHASGKAIMVPTNTATEWTTFRNNRPSGVAMAACPVTCSGTMVGGYCWYYGALGASCTQTCSGRGGVNMSGTRNYAGSGGTDARCQTVLTALHAASSSYNMSNCTNVYGCMTQPNYSRRHRCAGTTTAESASSRVRRACACNN